MVAASNSPQTSADAIPERTRITRRALVVWCAAVLAYIAAITGRTSFGVAGVEAIEHFHADASRIAVFTALQVGVYAAAQIPTGLLIDRFGARRVLVSGALVMGLGQIILGCTASYPVALAARVLIGAGDATTFLSALRILPYWFPLRWAPLFAQLTGSLGQIGQIISAVPFLAFLHAHGWTTSFVGLGGVILIVGIAAAVAVADSPEPPETSGPPAASDSPTRSAPGGAVRDVLRSTVCWEGFFIHFSTMLPQATFTLLWGLPLMTLGLGLSSQTAGLVLTVNTATIMAAGPVMGLLSARLGAHRDVAVVIAILVLIAGWAWFFLSPSPRGLAAIIALNILTAGLTPTSNYGFDYVREHLPRHRVATGTGLSNMGGFVATMIASQLAGMVLDAHSGSEGYQWLDFRAAGAALLVVWGLGLAGLVLFALRRRSTDSGARPRLRVVRRSDTVPPTA